jgi:hypothetical protein
MKLIYEHYWGGEGCSGLSIVPFEYESKEKFIFDMLEKYNESFWVGKHRFHQTEVLGCYLGKSDILGIKHNIFTLDEWFEQNKHIS